MEPLSLTARVIARLAEPQLGRVGRRQLLDAGIDPENIKSRLRHGALRREHAGVYSVPGTPRTPEAIWVGAVLAAGEAEAMVCRQTTAALYGFGPSLVLPAHVLARGEHADRDNLCFHRTRNWPARIVWRGVPTTTPFRGLEDLRRVLPRAEFGDLVVNARARNLVGPEALELFAPGRELTLSRLERIAVRLVKRHGLPRPKVNHRVLGRRRDLVWPAYRLVVEVDGPHHALPPQRRIDINRDRELTLAGWRCLRYSEEELEILPHELATLLSSPPAVP